MLLIYDVLQFVLIFFFVWDFSRCPVCRAEITKWDGKGGGVIGLKARAVFSL
jgi:hypothetical protein